MIEPLRHSRLGIISFSLSILVTLIVIFAFFVATRLTQQAIPAHSSAIILTGFGLLFAFCLNLIGIGLSLFGLFEKERKKIFAILGFVINLSVLICVLSVMITGMVIT